MNSNRAIHLISTKRLTRGGTSASRSFPILDRLQASSLRAVLRGETCRLSPQPPLSLWCGSRPARPFGPVGGRCRDFSKQDGEEDRPSLRPHASASSPAVCSPSPRSLAIDARQLTMTARFCISHKTGLATALFLWRGSLARASDRCCFVWRLATALALRARWPARFYERWQDRLLVYQ